jgi:hypothetical protein
MIKLSQEQQTSGSNISFDLIFYPTPKGRKPKTERQMINQTEAFLREMKNAGDSKENKILITKATKFHALPAYHYVIDHMTPLANSKESELTIRTWAMDIVDGKNHYLIHAGVANPDQSSLSSANALWNRMLKEIKYNPQQKNSA